MSDFIHQNLDATDMSVDLKYYTLPLPGKADKDKYALQNYAYNVRNFYAERLELNNA